MGDLISISGIKQKKLDEKILSDINDIIKVIDYSYSALYFFKHYGLVLEILMLLEADKKMLVLNRKKYEDKLAKPTPEHTT